MIDDDLCRCGVTPPEESSRHVKSESESESDHLAVPLQEGPGRAASVFYQTAVYWTWGRMGSSGAFTSSCCAVSMRCDREAESVSGPLSVGCGSCTRCSFVDGIVLGWHI